MVVSTLKKALKGLFFAFLLLGFLTSAFLWMRYLKNPPQTFPYPYTNNIQLSEDEQELASSADILLIGDTLAVHYDQYISQIVVDLSQKLVTRLKFYNWARPGEPLHITLSKLEKLKKIPSLVIYHGGVDEYQVKRISLKNIPSFLSNYKLTQNDLIYSLILTSPIFSRLFYTPYDHLQLSQDIPSYSKLMSSSEKEQIKEITHILHKQEVADMLSFIRAKKSQAILITAPLNLRFKQIESCSNTTNVGIDKRLLFLEKQIQEGKAKNVLTELQEITKQTLANSKAFFILGQALFQLGDFVGARSAYHKAKIYDCSLKGGDLLFNYSLVSQFENAHFPVIDFHHMIQNFFGAQKVFDVELFPMPKFYKEINILLENQITAHFKLNKGSKK